MITWDARKRRSNLAKHGIDLALAELFDLDTAQVEEDRDVRHETRFRGTGFIGDRIFFMVFTLNEEGDPHVISLRPATPKEKRRYAERS
jgi:uncharacterized DUF497 family protein